MSRSALLAAAIAALLASAMAEAGSFNVSPIHIDLPPDGTATTVHLRNNSADPTFVQVHAVAWGDDIDARSKTTDVIAMPPIFELPGNGRQTLRLALRRPLEASAEKAYRLVVTEVPRDTGAPNALAMTLRLDLPVFSAPTAARPQPVFVLQPRGTSSSVILRNIGQAHVRVERLSVTNGENRSLLASDRVTYALAGESVSWPLDLPLARLPATLEVRADTNHGPITATLTRPAP